MVIFEAEPFGMIARKSIFIILIILPVFIGGAIFWGIYKPDLTIFPGFNVDWYSDHKNDQGNSKLHYLTVQNNKLEFSYTLNDGYEYPYLGVSVFPDSGFIDLSDYDFIEVHVEAEKSKRIPLHILVNVPGFSNSKDPISYRQMELELNYQKGQQVYELELSKFKTPSWWFNTWELNENDVGPPDYSKVKSFSLQNCQILKTGEKETIKVSKIVVGKNNLAVGLITGGTVIGFYLFAFLWLKYNKKGFKELPYKRLEVGNLADEELSKISGFIAENFHDSSINSEILQKELGMSEIKISTSLKSGLNTTFKKYLNQVRIQEARRLLKDTDRQISDIAYLVGYTNISHFNRVFKETEGCPPGEFRKKVSQPSQNPVI